MNSIAREFLTRCFASDSTIALLLRSDNPAKIQQRVVALEQALTPRYLGWMTHENANGANIYVAANPLKSGSRRRTKESIASVRHVYLDIDQDGDARLAALQASEAVPAPFAILSTSPGKYQLLWRVECFDFEQQEITLKRLASCFGGDPACTDRNRVLRLPGFLNWRYFPAHRVSVEYGNAKRWKSADFQLETHPGFPIFLPGGHRGRKASHKETRSEQDWAFVCGQIADGKDADKLTGSWRRAAPTNPTHSTMRSALSTWHPRVNGCSKARRLKT